MRDFQTQAFRLCLFIMNSTCCVYWQDEGMWLGYLEEFPDYMTQGKTMGELEENLKDIYRDVTGGSIP